MYDGEGNELEVDVREDEEQNVKLQQTVELLLAAGYFRARIKGLSPFDKVVGGMTWCISTCNVDVDVDLLFQENSTIGQKIALTEKIVAVLPRMKCPHRIEPHQIQGLDFIHIYPVVQWLVKRAIETREEMGDYIRAYSISQFNRVHKMPEDEEFDRFAGNATETLATLKNTFRPRRRYRRSADLELTDEESRVQSTLLEYGQKYGTLRTSKTEKSGETAQKAAAVTKSLGGGAESTEQEEARQAEEEEKRIAALLQGMSSMETQEGKLTASAVGSLVGLQSAQIQEIASHYADKQSELEKSDKVGGAAHHQRQTTSLRKQIEQQSARLEQVQQKHAELKETYIETRNKLKEVEEQSIGIDQQLTELETMETGENQDVLNTLRELVATNEKLKQQEKEFRAQCKEELARIQSDIEKLKTEAGEDTPEERERIAVIQKQYEADKLKAHKIRLLLARKNREIAGLQRRIDEVPSRAELSQYQRRFVELYNQVAAKHKETKQFYTLYNTLDDSKLYRDKEVKLLNSIHETFEQAMSSSNREQFLKQFEQIVEGVKQNRVRLEKRKQEEKMKRDQSNDTYLDLVEKQRLYFKTVRDFTQECRKNEILLSKVQGS